MTQMRAIRNAPKIGSAVLAGASAPATGVCRRSSAAERCRPALD